MFSRRKRAHVQEPSTSSSIERISLRQMVDCPPPLVRWADFSTPFPSVVFGGYSRYYRANPLPSWDDDSPSYCPCLSCYDGLGHTHGHFQALFAKDAKSPPSALSRSETTRTTTTTSAYSPPPSLRRRKRQQLLRTPSVERELAGYMGLSLSGGDGEGDTLAVGVAGASSMSKPSASGSLDHGARRSMSTSGSAAPRSEKSSLGSRLAGRSISDGLQADFEAYATAGGSTDGTAAGSSLTSDAGHRLHPALHRHLGPSLSIDSTLSDGSLAGLSSSDHSRSHSHESTTSATSTPDSEGPATPLMATPGNLGTWGMVSSDGHRNDDGDDDERWSGRNEDLWGGDLPEGKCDSGETVPRPETIHGKRSPLLFKRGRLPLGAIPPRPDSRASFSTAKSSFEAIEWDAEWELDWDLTLIS